MYTNFRSFFFSLSLTRKITRLALYRSSLEVSFALKKIKQIYGRFESYRFLASLTKNALRDRNCHWQAHFTLLLSFFLTFSQSLLQCTILRRVIVSYSLYLNLGKLLHELTFVWKISLFSFVVSGRKNTLFQKKKKKKTMFYSIVDNRKNKTLQSYAYDWERKGGAEQLCSSCDHVFANT